ncbi:alpha-1,3/1,6-mannosyltransferase Alg2p [[Candida] railenensis]|uniref:Alpha-1,3/1,6-mannosyltransferase ALG2 n=1 Tax=[Candida] railenensis TaxID=45579 RepID=A0A9P0QPX0_9ASCO|nr:alpha-1,3/1,6-mannosyltransferase Alg2p [[Candida] railenensis]
MSKYNKKIAFIHPDLGIGGAERLVVDAAMGLQELGNDITIYTSHCDKSHCFEEVSNGDLDTVVYGDFLPTKLAGKFHILFAILRQFYLTFKLIVTGEILQYDYFIVDQLSVCVPLLELFARKDSFVLFYCHFPDQLLSQKGSILKTIYRYPFNAIEEWTTGLSDRIVVNSNFTKSIFHKTFKNLAKVDPGVIYPCVDVQSAQSDVEADVEVRQFMKGGRYFLSVNRFERKKDIAIAIRAFAKFKDVYNERETDTTNANKPRLIVAGGFDPRVSENVEYLRELTTLSESLNLKPITMRGKLLVLPPSTDVLFLPSIKSSIKTSLIKKCELLLYTPSFEHFGIVPVESMLCQVPVVGTNTGGPLESIVNYDFTKESLNAGATGYISQPDADLWGGILVKHYFEVADDVREILGSNGLTRVNKLFSRVEMSKAFWDNLIKSQKGDKGFVFNILKLWKVNVLILLLATSLGAYKLTN